MFIYNFKFNQKKILIIGIIILLIILSCVFFKILLSNTFNVKDSNNSRIPINMNTTNYTDILKLVYDNTPDYLNKTIKITGYVYRNSDFHKDQFVIARKMLVHPGNQEFVVGFLCIYRDASDFKDGTWVELEGTISKCNYKGEIPCINVQYIKEIEKPSDEFVTPPNGFYVK